MLVFFWNYYVEVAEEDNAKKYQAFFLATYKTTAQAHGERRREQEQPNFTAIPSTTPGRLSTWESPFLKTCVGTPTSWTWSTKPTKPSTSCDGHWRSGPFTPKIRRTKHLSAQFWNTLAVSGTRTPPRTSAKLRLCSEGRQGGVVNPHRQTSSVGKTYDQLKRSPLDERRRRARLTTFFKFHRGEVVINITRKPSHKPSHKTNMLNSPRGLSAPCLQNTVQAEVFLSPDHSWVERPPTSGNSVSHGGGQKPEIYKIK